MATLKCEITNNICGTDTWMKDRLCICPNCQKWLYGELKRLRQENAELAKALKELLDSPSGATGAPSWESKLRAHAVLNKQLQPCGHPRSEIVSSDEGTSYCGACEREANGKDL